MRKIRIFEHVSLDGVIQAPGKPDEDREGNFEHGGWGMRYPDPAVREAIVRAHEQPFDLLLGRRTYDIWSTHWPNVQSDKLADGLNAATKYVATHRPDSLAWGPVQDLGADIVEAVRGIKSKSGPDIIVWGSSTLTPLLLEQGLADELLLFVHPVLLGRGKRFFSNAGPCALALVGTKAAASGILMNAYRPTQAQGESP